MGPIEAYLVADHRRLEALLDRADGEPVDAAAFEVFRAGLLRHIGLEEKLLVPAARRVSGHAPAMAAALRRDHGAIASLLVPTPTRAIIAELRGLLAEHNPLEEGPDGLYPLCDSLLGDEAAALVERMRTVAPPPLAPHFDGPGALRTAAEARAAVRRT